MATYVDNSQINLSINAKQANTVMDLLKKQAEDLRARMDAAAKAGDAKTVKKIKAELNQVTRIIRLGTTETLRLEQVMRNLDKASPKELQKTLKTLKQDLNKIERGSKAWDEHVEKIRRVREELKKIDQSIIGQQSRWSKLNAKINEWQTAALGAVAAVTGVVMAGKEAVQKYADMDQEMAGVRKFTGMAADEVAALNESFKTIDTRTSRVELNKLAQEAGRLGKQSQEDVLGFVRASDKVNVALDDLGDGATLTLSKLTGIFGDEERYGTEQSLLKVGSVINELSQNCSASAPYIANFTERLGGVGAQAGMTIQQIMGFGAVLDSNSQKVEASATALSQVIVRLYQDPAKYARVAGLEVESFSKLMREDANAALLLFLETLNKAGGMDVLSPMFKDMGENGSRAIAALSTLAKNIDAVKSQQEAANKAFEEGTSIDQEFAVQNNTVQASMDKARNSINEIAVDLGEKLQPIMKHVYSSSSIMLRVLSSLVTFTINHASALGTLVAMLAAYKLATMAAAVQTKALSAAKAIHLALSKANTIAMNAEAVVVALLTGNLGKARAAWKALTLSMSASPVGLITAALAGLVAILVSLRKKTDEFAESSKKIISRAKEVSAESIKEQRELDILMGKLKGATKDSNDYADAKEKIISQYGKYLSGLIDEKGEIIDLSKAYDTLSEAVRRSARERALASAKENLETSFLESSSSDISKLQDALENYGASAMEASRMAQQVASAIISGENIPVSVKAEISRYASGLPVKDSTGKEYWNSGQRRFAKAGLAMNAPESPEEILDRLTRSVATHDSSLKNIEEMQRTNNPAMDYSVDILRNTILDLDKVIREGKGTVSVPGIFIERKEPVQTLPQTTFSMSGNYPSSLMPKMEEKKVPEKFEEMELSVEIASQLRDKIAHELNLRGVDLYKPAEDYSDGSPDIRPEGPNDSKSDPFKDAFRKLESERIAAEERAIAENAAGLTNWLEYLEAKHQAQVDFYEKADELYNRFNKTEDDGYADLLRKEAEEFRTWKERTSAVSIEEVKRRQKTEETEVRISYASRGILSRQEEQQLQDELFDIRIKAMQRELELTNRGSKEYAAKKEEIEQALSENLLRKRENLARETARLEQEYASQSAAEKLRMEVDIINSLRDGGMISEQQAENFTAKAKEKSLQKPGRKEKSRQQEAREYFSRQKNDLDEMLLYGLLTEQEYSERVSELREDLNRTMIEGIGECGSEWVSQLANMYTAWTDFAEALKDPEADPFRHLASGLQAAAAVMGSVMQSVTALTNAEVEIQTQAIERRYQRESAFAEGNAYLQAKLEKKKEKEIAKLKSDASKKNFAMQVAMTVASTAANAVSAYGAALQVGGLAGLVLAPIAAGLALAQGAVQIAVLKKQQQAAETTGYSEGGFTRKGRKDEPAGIVHAGEWVASQKLVNNPRTRPVIDMLEYAQRTNTVASLSMEDVSRSISAPMALAYSQPVREVVIDASRNREPEQQPSRLSEAIDRLNDRLERPFITHNSIEGPYGFRQAKEEYDRLIRNKSK